MLEKNQLAMDIQVRKKRFAAGPRPAIKRNGKGFIYSKIKIGRSTPNRSKSILHASHCSCTHAISFLSAFKWLTNNSKVRASTIFLPSCPTEIYIIINRWRSKIKSKCQFGLLKLRFEGKSSSASWSSVIQVSLITYPQRTVGTSGRLWHRQSTKATTCRHGRKPNTAGRRKGCVVDSWQRKWMAISQVIWSYCWGVAAWYYCPWWATRFSTSLIGHQQCDSFEHKDKNSIVVTRIHAGKFKLVYTVSSLGCTKRMPLVKTLVANA
jgi:hypothetical protein